MGPATTVGTLPEETGTSGTAQQKHILGGGWILYFKHSNA